MRLATLALLAAASTGANAQGIVPNIEDGRVKTYTCTGCHGVDGWRNAYPSYPVPKIRGQHFDYLVTALNDYRSGVRQHPTMQAQGEALSDQDIADISAYLSGGAPVVAAAAAPVEARPVEATPADSATDAATPADPTSE
jgi:cytochrome c553